jgi:hypothetical protein
MLCRARTRARRAPRALCARAHALAAYHRAACRRGAAWMPAAQCRLPRTRCRAAPPRWFGLVLAWTARCLEGFNSLAMLPWDRVRMSLRWIGLDSASCSCSD